MDYYCIHCDSGTHYSQDCKQLKRNQNNNVIMKENDQLKKIMLIGTIMGLQSSLNAADPFTFDQLIEKPITKLMYIQGLVLSLYNEVNQIESYLS